MNRKHPIHGDMPLMSAVAGFNRREEREKCARLLLKVEADVNVHDKDNRTVLLSAHCSLC